MTQKDNILQELNELQSSLVNAGFLNVYQVPAGYFDNLAELVLSRIRALDAKNAAEELSYLSSLLSSLSKKMPYSVPADFFTRQEESIAQIVNNESREQTVEDELKELSPLLGSLKKEMPFSVPAGYFESIEKPVATAPAKVVSITRQSWFRYAAAAVVIGCIAISGFLIWGNGKTVDPRTESAEWVKKNLKKVSTDEINNFVQLTDENTPVFASTETKSEAKDKNDVRDLIKDIPEKDIQSFLDDTQSTEPEEHDDALMN